MKSYTAPAIALRIQYQLVRVIERITSQPYRIRSLASAQSSALPRQGTLHSRHFPAHSVTKQHNREHCWLIDSCKDITLSGNTLSDFFGPVPGCVRLNTPRPHCCSHHLHKRIAQGFWTN